MRVILDATNNTPESLARGELRADIVAETLEDAVLLGVGKIPAGSRWRHLKTGNVYVVQRVEPNVATLMPVVVYQREDPTGEPVVSTRDLVEFLDGRFERL